MLNKEFIFMLDPFVFETEEENEWKINVSNYY